MRTDESRSTTGQVAVRRRVSDRAHRSGAGVDVAEARRLLGSIDEGRGLPTEWFTDGELFRAELRAVHRRSWHYVAHTGALPAPGSVLPLELAGVPIVLVRDENGSIAGFVNVCRHRGHIVVLDAGTTTRVTCRYHAWSYGLDGTLKSAPRSAGDPHFDPAELGLVAIQVAVWGPMVWANLDVAAPSLDSWVDGMPERLAADGLDVDACSFAFDHVWDIDANWKIFQDNTIECYHCPSAHPELSRVLEMNPTSQRMDVGGPFWLWHTMPFRKGFTDGLTYRAHGADRATYFYQWVFPTTYLQHAGRGFDIGSVKVIAPGRIRLHHICFMPDDTPAETIAEGWRTLGENPTILQDVAICNRVQRGHDSGVAPPGRFLARPEWLLREMNKRVVEMTGGLR